MEVPVIGNLQVEVHQTGGGGWPSSRIVTAQVCARQESSDADLRGFAESLSAALPASGERPALVDRLLLDGLVERSALFFHEEISV